MVFLLGFSAFHYPAPDDGQAAKFVPYVQGSYYPSNPPRTGITARGVQQVAHSRQPATNQVPERGAAQNEAVTPLFGMPPAAQSLPPRSPKFDFQPAPVDTVPLVTPAQKRAVPSQYESGSRNAQPRLETADAFAAPPQSGNADPFAAPGAGPTQPFAASPALGPSSRQAPLPPIAGKPTPGKVAFAPKTANTASQTTAEPKAEKRPVAKMISKLPLLASRSTQETLAPTPADVTPSSRVIVRPPLRPRYEVAPESYTHSGFTAYGTPYGGGPCHGGCCDRNCCFPPVCGQGLDPCRCGDTTGCVRQSCCDCLCCCRYKCRSTCNMHPHYPYYPAYHGYYYYRPYNYIHVAMQKQIALTLGEDPAAPYGVTAFDRLYADLMIETYEEPGIGEEALNPTPRQTAPPLPDLQEVLENR